MVMLALGYALRRKWAKELPAMPDPDMRTLGLDMLRVEMWDVSSSTVEEPSILLLATAWRTTKDAFLYIRVFRVV